MPSLLFDEFRDTLEAAMEENGVTGQELSRRSGIHWVTISRILNKQVDNTGFEVADKLLSAVGVTAKLSVEKVEPKKRKSS